MPSPRMLSPAARGRGVTAVLGPTNTGKTHLAIERMLAQPSGLIGLPLRLLAREVYGRMVERAGEDKVALITGEERIKPPSPRYWVSTVEAMPQDLDVDFLAIDEIQLAADLDRGHVFTDRLLNRRGRHETLVLGAATMRPMVEKLLPGANILGRPRLSRLSFAGEKKITRLPRRSAVVAFSADEVYAIAEVIRRQRGGAAVVMGALSPRTRNAQVALYQSGEVEYLVATDAIGMGLNLDVDHIAFASDRKFDGFQFRRLNPAEFGQIAGRAGRHLSDGTFGTSGRCPPFEPELVERLESHAFDPARVLQWRNAALDFSSLESLQASLAQAPEEPGLTRAPSGEDVTALEHAARDPEIRELGTSSAAVQRLWEVCQVPDYRKVAPAAHAELVTILYGFLARTGTIPTDWFAGQVRQSERVDGDIDTLSARIAHIRTWTFVANRPDWLSDAEHWRGVTRGVEDMLSDALHERLTERFVDRRTSVLMRRLRDKDMLEAEITAQGDVLVEGQHVGRLAGFRFTPDASADGPDGRALRAAAQKALGSEFESRAERLSAAADADIVLATDGTMRWLGEPVGRLAAGEKLLAPRVRLIADETLSAPAKEKAEHRLSLWIASHVQKLLGALVAIDAAEDLTGMARGVAFQLVESLGVLDRAKVADEVKGLDQDARAALRKYGVRFGAYHLYLPTLLKPAPRALAAQLWALRNGGLEIKGLDEIPALAASGRTSFRADPETPKPLYRALGYRVSGERAVRVDILERLADLIRPAINFRPGATPGAPPPGAAEGNGFTATVAMTSLVGCSGEEFASILRSLGYRMERRPAPAGPAVDPPAVAQPDGPPVDGTDRERSATELVAETATGASDHETGGDLEGPDGPDISVASGGEADDATEQAVLAHFDTVASRAAAGATAAEHMRQEDVPEQAAQSEGGAEGSAEPSAEISDQPAPPAQDGPEASASSAAALDAVEAEPAEVEAVAAAEPVETASDPEPSAPKSVEETSFVEIWRPGGRSEHRRPERRPAPSHRRAYVPPNAAVEKPSGDRDPASGHRSAPPRRSRESGPPRADQSGRPQAGNRAKEDHRRGDRGEGNRAPNLRQPNRGREAPKPVEQRPRERERAPDPNSPFAALAELKARLDAEAKSRS